MSNLYGMRGGKYGENEDPALDHDLILINYFEVSSLETTNNLSAIRRLVDDAFPNKGSRAKEYHAGQLHMFANEVQIGDEVLLLLRNSKQVAKCRVTGNYEFTPINKTLRHTRKVEWLQKGVPTSSTGLDRRTSLFQRGTIWKIASSDTRRDVEPSRTGTGTVDDLGESLTDLTRMADEQIFTKIESKFAGHDMARLVDEVLKADGWVTKISPPGPDEGVDILAGRGSLGMDSPKLCVQVKSQKSQANVEIYRTLRGSMQTFKADQGLLVCWGGFNSVVRREARLGHFEVRFWESKDLVEEIYRNYDKLPADIQAELPLKQIWILVPEDSGE